MDETRVDITNQEDGAGDDIALLQAQYTRIRGSPNTADTGLVFLRCLLPRCVTRGGMSRELRQGLFAEMRSELLRSQQEIAMGVRGFKVSHSSIHW